MLYEIVHCFWIFLSPKFVGFALQWKLLAHDTIYFWVLKYLYVRKTKQMLDSFDRKVHTISPQNLTQKMVSSGFTRILPNKSGDEYKYAVLEKHHKHKCIFNRNFQQNCEHLISNHKHCVNKLTAIAHALGRKKIYAWEPHSCCHIILKNSHEHENYMHQKIHIIYLNMYLFDVNWTKHTQKYIVLYSNAVTNGHDCFKYSHAVN